jgi:hypothetical protein
MPSRLWLAAAFVLAFGPSPARAETDLIAFRLDQAKIAKLLGGTTTLIIGKSFAEAGGEITARDGYATGGGAAAAPAKQREGAS